MNIIGSEEVLLWMLWKINTFPSEGAKLVTCCLSSQQQAPLSGPDHTLEPEEHCSVFIYISPLFGVVAIVGMHGKFFLNDFSSNPRHLPYVSDAL